MDRVCMSYKNCRKSILYIYVQGLYAMSMNCMEAAEAQFKTAVEVFIL